MWNADVIKRNILDYYYNEVYTQFLFLCSVQSRGINYFGKSLEKYWIYRYACVDNVLEIGAGQGEHLPFVLVPPRKSYVCLDLREVDAATALLNVPVKLSGLVEFIKGNAEDLSFSNLNFDRTLATCLLHHVDNPLKVLLEARRVTKIGGEICFLLPADPGILNQLVKLLISTPRMKKFSKVNPKLIYALEHRNHVSGLLQLVKFVFQEDEVKIHYDPFKIPSWNFNLLCVVHIVRANSEPNFLVSNQKIERDLSTLH